MTPEKFASEAMWAVIGLGILVYAIIQLLLSHMEGDEE